jgi:riboflavin kinase/FMN adenylyltransferase
VRIWNGIEACSGEPGAVVASIGNYDGVHVGHQSILERVVDHARALGLRSMLITFDPHPVAVLAPQRRLQRLQTRGQKLESLERTGLTDLLILEFDESLAALDGDAFFERLIGESLGLSAIHVGENFRFGRGRSGNLDLLRSIGDRRGFEVHGVPTIEVDGRPVSSSAIRAALNEGDVEIARRMLGRPFELTGEVVRGDGRGRALGCPTANVETKNEIVPARGVYLTETIALASRLPSITNVGNRPTFGGDALTVETHLLDFDDDLYDEQVDVHFLARMRDEVSFENTAALVEQLARDCAAAEAFFAQQRLEHG